MKLQISPERGGLLVSAKDALPSSKREQGEHMLLAAAMLEAINEQATFVVEDEALPSIEITGWIARKAGRNTVLGCQPSSELLAEWKRLEQETGRPWELRVKTVQGLGRAPFLRPSRDKKPQNNR